MKTDARTAKRLFSYSVKGEKMKFTKIETQGITYLVFSLGTLPKEPERLARAAADRAGGIGADGVLLLTPTLKADVRLTAFDSKGGRTLSHEDLYALAAYLSYVAGLPIYEYETETDEGIHPVKILQGEPPKFSVKYGKCKRYSSNIPITVHEVDATVDLVATENGTYAVLFSSDADAVDLPALAGACAMSPDARADAVVTVSPAADGEGPPPDALLSEHLTPRDLPCTPSAPHPYRMRVKPISKDAVSPTAAAGAALSALIARRWERYGGEAVFHHDAGIVACRLDHAGRLEATSDARLLLRGEYEPITDHRASRKTRRPRG